MAIATEGNAGAVSDQDPDLVAYWKFDEGKGYLVKDSTGHGNDLYLTGEPKWQVCTEQHIAGLIARNNNFDPLPVLHRVSGLQHWP